ncbi:MAG: thiamine phosphate synthase, partial [Rhizobium altiplani]
MTEPENRCRLVLIAPDIADVDEQAKIVGDALKGGDVASVIVPQYSLNDGEFQKHAEKLVPIIQESGAAALLAGDSRVVGRSKADGLHLTGPA